MLVVELDGHSHDLRRAHDAARDRFMAEAGYKVLRFTNADVHGKVGGAVTSIRLPGQVQRSGSVRLTRNTPLRRSH